MSALWRWDLLNADGAPLTGGDPAQTFPTQSEAESWVGWHWPELVEAGGDAVTLQEGDVRVYGPMSLRPAE